MNDAQAKRLVVGAFLVAGSLAAVKDFREDRRLPQMRILVGGFVAASVLAMVAEASPELAGTFAVLILLSALMLAGPDVIGAVTGAVTTAGAATGATPTP